MTCLWTCSVCCQVDVQGHISPATSGGPQAPYPRASVFLTWLYMDANVTIVKFLMAFYCCELLWAQPGCLEKVAHKSKAILNQINSNLTSTRHRQQSKPFCYMLCPPVPCGCVSLPPSVCLMIGPALKAKVAMQILPTVGPAVLGASVTEVYCTRLLSNSWHLLVTEGALIMKTGGFILSFIFHR